MVFSHGCSLPRFAKLVFSSTETNLDGVAAVGVRNLFNRPLPVTSRIGFADILQVGEMNSVSAAHLVRREERREVLLLFRGFYLERRKKRKYKHRE